MKVLLLLCISLFPTLLLGQTRPSRGTDETSDDLFPIARVEEKVVYDLDPARAVKLMDANPSGTKWFVVDAFAGWQNMVIDGHRYTHEFHEITSSATRLSPNGDHVIWTGLVRNITQHSFDSTVAFLYQDSDYIGSFVSDYPEIEFSRSGNRWAVLLPYAYQQQTGDRDFVVVDGKVASKNEVYPHQFSFSHDEASWAYRATDNLQEKIVTSDGQVATLFTRREPAISATWDPTVWRFTPDVSINHKQLEGRDYDLNFEKIARQYRTAYSTRSKDTARAYMTYGGKAQGLYRWISNVIMDTAGKHLAYFACDPKITRFDSVRDEQRGVVVYDGQVVAGPYSGVARLFLSPSAEHYAYSLSKAAGEFYLDKKRIAKTAQVMDCVWSPDESKVAFIAIGEHDKIFVVANNKRSPLFEQVGRIGWSADGKSVEFVGVQNAKVIKVRQAF